jgi:micrococcal nuclease
MCPTRGARASSLRGTVAPRAPAARPRYDAPVRRAAAVLLIAALAGPARPAEPRVAPARSSRGTVVLGGERVDVRWIDGDTFAILSGRHAGRNARLAGVNALETYGPVHRLGTTGGAELLQLARRSAAVAAAAGGRCETDGKSDRYRRLLVRCAAVAEALVRGGLAMVFALGTPAEPGLLSLQADAQQRRAGIWSGGAPRLVPASLHSADERELGPGGAYDRVADTRTGATEIRRHDRIYRVCEEVCLGDGADRSCLVYVPYERRYRDKPACLRHAPAD